MKTFTTNLLSQKQTTRWLAIDCLRGLAIFFMAIVNHPGSWDYVYAPLKESEWIGHSPADLIFPTFIFVVGISIVLAFSRPQIQLMPKATLFKKIIIRALLLFLIGILIHADSNVHFRIPGVLQRIAVVYACCSFLYFYCSPKSLIFLSIAILIVHWGLLTLIPVPGVGGPHLMPTETIAAWLDNYFLHDHMLGSTKTWDPEGIISTLPSIVTGILGMLVGNFLLNKYKPNIKSIGLLLIMAACLIIVALIWGEYFPVIKKLWTSSFVLWAAGWATLLLAILLYLIDIKKWVKPFIFFIVIGKNALFLYIVEELLGRIFTRPIWIFEEYFSVWLPPYFASFLFALCVGFSIVILGYWLDRKNIYFKL